MKLQLLLQLGSKIYYTQQGCDTAVGNMWPFCRSSNNDCSTTKCNSHCVSILSYISSKKVQLIAVCQAFAAIATVQMAAVDPRTG